MFIISAGAPPEFLQPTSSHHFVFSRPLLPVCFCFQRCQLPAVQHLARGRPRGDSRRGIFHTEDMATKELIFYTEGRAAAIEWPGRCITTGMMYFAGGTCGSNYDALAGAQYSLAKLKTNLAYKVLNWT